MTDRWLNRIVFWILAIVPFWCLFIVLGFYGGMWFGMGLIVYALVYRPIIEIYRLLKLERIEEKDAWKFFIPFYSTKYSKSIWFG